MGHSSQASTNPDLQQGKWQDRQIVSEEWVNAATKPDAPHLQPGVNKEFPLGYGYQWWIPETLEGEFSAIGVYNQFIYVNPTRDLVVVKLSAFSDYAKIFGLFKTIN